MANCFVGLSYSYLCRNILKLENRSRETRAAAPGLLAPGGGQQEQASPHSHQGSSLPPCAFFPEGAPSHPQGCDTWEGSDTWEESIRHRHPGFHTFIVKL